jgi:hypothetical protein
LTIRPLCHIDISEDTIGCAGALTEESGLVNVRFLVADIQELQLQTESVDAFQHYDTVRAPFWADVQLLAHLGTRDSVGSASQCVAGRSDSSKAEPSASNSRLDPARREVRACSSRRRSTDRSPGASSSDGLVGREPSEADSP